MRCRKWGEGGEEFRELRLCEVWKGIEHRIHNSHDLSKLVVFRCGEE